ncbi:hypothetical protein HYPSUDRAFT_217305 [Hypholoma sublateritium FD-334 SS-4]|uniref:Uncharacterized protein n=1 Tax=Hypholoma sublateritium (strain FD-334 SS-4) TaxID=945553 RepID=A0A0D2PJB9_HYPSF|nr:hypothetical protein HYPSUDRAFT_217305 [Hypholoma sublateritium FD-334 SS-4]
MLISTIQLWAVWLVSIFSPSYLKEKVSFVVDIVKCIAYLLSARLSNKDIDVFDARPGHRSISQVISLHGHFTAAITSAIVEFLACFVLAFKYRLRGSRKHIFPVVKRRAQATLSVAFKYVIRRATHFTHHAGRTSTGTVAEGVFVRLVSTCSSVLKELRNNFYFILGDDNIALASTWTVNLIEQLFNALSEAVSSCLDSIFLESRRSSLVWAIYAPTSTAFALTLYSMSISLAFISAYTSDPTTAVFKPKRSRTIREKKSASYALVPRLFISAETHNQITSQRRSPVTPNKKHSNETSTIDASVISAIKKCTVPVPDICIIPPDDSTTAHNPRPRRYSSTPPNTRPLSEELLRALGCSSLGLSFPCTEHSNLRFSSPFSQIDSSDASAGVINHTPEPSSKVRVKVVAGDNKENQSVQCTTEHANMWASERRSRLMRAPSTPAKRKGKARAADSLTLNAAPMKARSKGATRQIKIVRDSRRKPDVPMAADTTVFMTPEGTSRIGAECTSEAGSDVDTMNCIGRMITSRDKSGLWRPYLDPEILAKLPPSLHP